MSSPIFGLPAIPADLKPIIPFLQRADELKSQDPVISYWCAYYAAQVGIGLKARSTAARDVLFALLGSLEHLKADIGPNDAIDIESVSSAYVENFALKVFANADNEDRNGRASRSTAKKFLAAANFLEILKTFPKMLIAESNEEKIRYAKWKAADIAKAFREGHKPVPGPPGWAEEQEELRALQREQEEIHIPIPPSSSHPHFSTEASISRSPPRTNIESPPRSSHISSVSPSQQSFTSQSRIDPRLDLINPPESWSTTSTPGLETPDTFSIAVSHSSNAHDSKISPRSGISQAKQIWEAKESARTKPRSGSGSSSNTISSRGGARNEDRHHTPPSTPPKSSLKSASPDSDSDKRVHFTPSTAGSPPPPPPRLSSSPPKVYEGPSSIYAPQAPISPPIPPPTIPLHPPEVSPSYAYAAPPPPSQNSPTRSNYRTPYPSGPPPPMPPPPPVPIELTPALVVKAQKHCRFAISALDYEDAEQAKKELRAALALLGG